MGLRARVEALEKKEGPRLVECEKCGCLLREVSAAGGDVRYRVNAGNARILMREGFELKDILHTPYYCKVHAPKGRK